MDVPVYNMQGQEVGSMTIDEAALGGSVNAGLLKQAFVMYHANRRQGSARTKSRGEIEASTRKIYRQKGTGRARHGAKSVPQFRGGGHTFAKRATREDYHLSMPKKMRRKANRNALLAKLVDGEVKVIDSISFEKPQTKLFTAFLEAIGVDRSALVALASGNKNARLSARNIDGISLCRATELNTFEMLNHRYLVIAKDQLEAWLSGPSSQTDKSARLEPMGADRGKDA